MRYRTEILTILGWGQASRTQLHGDRFWRDQWLDANAHFYHCTEDAILDVSGNINLAQEQLDLTIHTNSKGLRVLSLRAPLYVRGGFKQPRVSADKGVLLMRAGGAIALAVLAPVAANSGTST